MTKFRHDRDILLAIIASNRVRGHGPSAREICTTIGVRSNAVVQRAIERLRSCGFIRLGYRLERGGLRATPLGMCVAGVFPAEEQVESLDMCA